MTIDEIVSAIRALPVPERLRVIEIVAHEAASDVPAAAEPAPRRGVTLVERHGLLLVDTDYRTDLPEEEELRRQLEAELQHPQDSGEPVIVIERPNPSTTHLFAIWSRFNGLEQVVRSRILLDAYSAARGEQEALRVTVSMGLTPSEAERMGIG